VQHSGDEKYIICQVKCLSKAHDEGQYVLVSYPLPYHSDIAKTYKQSLGPAYEIRVLGGGILKIDQEKRKIETYGTSASFGNFRKVKNIPSEIHSNFFQGNPDIELVRECLHSTFPDWELDVKVTDYIRG